MHREMIETMTTDALLDLYAGIVTPMDREILKDMPLPEDMVDPFASQDVEPLALMNLNYVSLSGWIAEARKEKYYSERFVQLSKLVMKGVTTMGRGLVTLHQRGEDLTAAPMQIEDLISVGSYHFRKSYLGVVQFSAKHPEIGERLLVNQLGWSTTLMRLYKTKEKLAKPVEITNQKSETLENKKSEISNQISGSADEDRPETEGLPAGNSDTSSFLPHHSSLDEAPVLNAMSALFEPAAFSAHRALSPLENKKSETTGNKKSEIRNKKSDDLENEEVMMKNEEKGIEGTENTEIESSVPDENLENEDMLTTDHQPLDTDTDSLFLPHNSSVDEDSESDDDGLPPYIRILQNAFGRSESNDEGRLTFTFDEVRCLAADPEFARIYPQAAADMREMAQHIDSG